MRISACALVVAVAAAWALSGSSATAVPAHTCADPVALVHDMASSTDEWSTLREQLESRGRCVDLVEYGETPATLPFDAIAGVAPLETSAAEIGAHLAQFEHVDVVAHGAGGLAVQHYLQHTASNPVRSLITIGPMWNGTNIGGLVEVEDLSRRLGTYDAVLALETPLVDPICGGCRQLITGSDFLTTLHDGGLRTDGVRYTDIISDRDLLVVPPRSAEVRASDTIVVQTLDPGNRTHHLALTGDPVVVSIAVGALE